MHAMRRLGLPVLVVALLALGCGSSNKRGSTSSTTSPHDTSHPVVTQTRGTLGTKKRHLPETRGSIGGFTGQDAHNYKQLKSVCSSFPRDQIAQEVGLHASAPDGQIAHRFAGGYQLPLRAAVEAGCRAGLRDR